MRVFIDTGVLIAAFRGKPEVRREALSILSEPSFEYWYSPLLKLETLLQPSHHNRKLEMEFYGEYFDHAQCFADLNQILEVAEPDAMKHGIPVIDALHIAAAHLSHCRFLFTTETPSKPLFRTKLVTVVNRLAPGSRQNRERR